MLGFLSYVVVKPLDHSCGSWMAALESKVQWRVRCLLAIHVAVETFLGPLHELARSINYQLTS